MNKPIQVDYKDSQFNKQRAKCEEAYQAVELERVKFVREVSLKAAELGGKVIMIHDEIILDLTVEQLLDLRAWASEHSAPALAKRGFL